MLLVIHVSDVIMSTIFGVLTIGGIIVWIVIYQDLRSSWGILGENISFIIPKGIP